jgi:hypothetical protein
MKCVNHPEVDATSTCVKCGKGLCIDCQRELHNKTYCQPCADEILTQKAGISLTLANIKKRKPNINLDKVRHSNKARYLGTASWWCFRIGFILTFIIPIMFGWMMLGGGREGELHNIIYTGITLAIAGIILAVLSLLCHVATASKKAAAGLLLGIVLIIFGSVYIVKSQEHTTPFEIHTFETYTDNISGFSISVPTYWYIQPMEKAGDWASFSYPIECAGVSLSFMVAKDNVSYTSLESDNDYHLISKQYLTIDGIPATKVIYTHIDNNGHTVQTMDYYLIDGDTLWWIGGTYAPTWCWDYYKGTFNTMANSFRVLD